MPPKITAPQLLALLVTRHNQDVFVPECICSTAGPNESNGLQRLDAWAIKKSWSPPCAAGYEIKVERNDFLSDDKWLGYLPYCNEFSFVAPPGIIKADEVPPEAGLVICSANATRLYTKKKAPYRNVEIPPAVFRYILFRRVRICSSGDDMQDNATFWQRWLAGKRELKGLGHRVSRTLQDRISKEIVKRDIKQQRLVREVEHLKDARTMLTNLGFDANQIPDEWQIERRLDKLKEAVPRDLIRAVREGEKALQTLGKIFQDIEDNRLPN